MQKFILIANFTIDSECAKTTVEGLLVNGRAYTSLKEAAKDGLKEVKDKDDSGFYEKYEVEVYAIPSDENLKSHSFLDKVGLILVEDFGDSDGGRYIVFYGVEGGHKYVSATITPDGKLAFKEELD